MKPFCPAPFLSWFCSVLPLQADFEEIDSTSDWSSLAEEERQQWIETEREKDDTESSLSGKEMCLKYQRRELLIMPQESMMTSLYCITLTYLFDLYTAFLPNWDPKQFMPIESCLNCSL